ncbi:heavy metal translocatin [Pleurotus eryngii]|uniref:Heavy metal translocatin n=1 Tax=Pleurotus eryngii TaxID=5323 RepID=A0A9P6A059_PLEER|nr:heavy metal translocatin [Pleurotus eryngii]
MCAASPTPGYQNRHLRLAANHNNLISARRSARLPTNNMTFKARNPGDHSSPSAEHQGIATANDACAKPCCDGLRADSAIDQQDDRRSLIPDFQNYRSSSLSVDKNSVERPEEDEDACLPCCGDSLDVVQDAQQGNQSAQGVSTGCDCCRRDPMLIAETKASFDRPDDACAKPCCSGTPTETGLGDVVPPSESGDDNCSCCESSLAEVAKMIEVAKPDPKTHCQDACCDSSEATAGVDKSTPLVNNESTCDRSEIPASPNAQLAQQPLQIRPNLAQKKLEDKLDCSCCMEKRGAVLYSSVSDNPSPTEVKDYIGRMVCCQAPCCQPPGSFSSALTSVSRRFLSKFRRARGKTTDEPSCCAEPTIDAGLSEKQVIDHGEPSTEVQTLFMTIGGMDCPSCTPRVERALRKLDQVTDIKLDHVSGTASCSYNPLIISPDKITEHVSSLTGFTCRRCVGLNSQGRIVSLRFLPGHVPSQVQLRRMFGVDEEDKENRVFVDQEDSSIVVFRLKSSAPPGSARAVLQRFSDAGFVCEPTFVNEHELMCKQAWDAVMRGVVRAALSICFLIPTLVLVWKPHLLENGVIARESIVFGLASAILFLASPILVGAYKTLCIAHHLDADVLVTISALSAYIYSLIIFAVGTASGHHIGLDSFFETSSLLVTLILISRVVSALVRWLAVSSYLSHVLGNDIPTHAEWVDPATNLTSTIHVSLLDAGDTIILSSGQVSPSDGIFVEGRAHFDEALVTGEANPVCKVPGSAVVAGSQLLSFTSTDSGSQNNTARITLTRAPHESSLAELRRIVSEARSSRPAIQDMADALATWLIPCVLVASIIVLVIWVLVEVLVRHSSVGRGFSQALTYTIALLASSCPCALTLCVPLVYCVVVAKVAVGSGILVKDANAFIGATKVTDVVFDKTGTLTTGKLTVVGKFVLPFTATPPVPGMVEAEAEDQPLKKINLDVEQVEALVLALVLDDKHPVSSGVNSFLLSSLSNAGAPGKLDDKKSIPGQGISALWNGNHVVKGGHLAFCLNAGDTAADVQGVHPDIARVVSLGKTLFVLSIDSQVIAAYALQDMIRPEAQHVVQSLRERGVRVSMLSGDNDEAAWETGKVLGFAQQDVRGGCAPQTKRDVVRQLVWKSECKQEEEEEDAGTESTDQPPSNSQPSMLGRLNIFTPARATSRFVIFVGDGSNDAGVLSQANLGISFQSGTTLANAAADVVLLSSQSSLSDSLSANSDLLKVLAVIDLSGSTKRRIVTCFVWAVMYNFLAFVLSSGILVVWRLEPQWAGVGELVSLVPVFLIAFAPRKKQAAFRE